MAIWPANSVTNVLSNVNSLKCLYARNANTRDADQVARIAARTGAQLRMREAPIYVRLVLSN